MVYISSLSFSYTHTHTHTWCVDGSDAYSYLCIEIESGVSGDTENPNEKGLKEKKKKLHDTLSRLIKYYVRSERVGVAYW